MTEIPVEVLELDFVEELNLSENQVRKISEHMGKLENLTDLNLGFNQISEIPSHILKLRSVVRHAGCAVSFPQEKVTPFSKFFSIHLLKFK